MNGVLTRLKNAGCNVNKGLETSYLDEERYLRSLMLFLEDDIAVKMHESFLNYETDKSRLYARSLGSTLFNLGLTDLYYLSNEIAATAERDKMELLITRFLERKEKYADILNSCDSSVS